MTMLSRPKALHSDTRSNAGRMSTRCRVPAVRVPISKLLYDGFGKRLRDLIQAVQPMKRAARPPGRVQRACYAGSSSSRLTVVTGLPTKKSPSKRLMGCVALKCLCAASKCLCAAYKCFHVSPKCFPSGSKCFCPAFKCSCAASGRECARFKSGYVVPKCRSAAFKCRCAPLIYRCAPDFSRCALISPDRRSFLPMSAAAYRRGPDFLRRRR